MLLMWLLLCAPVISLLVCFKAEPVVQEDDAPPLDGLAEDLLDVEEVEVGAADIDAM
jgi:hypothetical protein